MDGSNLVTNPKKSKGGELRIPPALLLAALRGKILQSLIILLVAKLLHNGRVRVNDLLEELSLTRRTGSKHIQKIVDLGWAGTDGEFLFPRSWHRLGLTKRGGLYLPSTELLSEADRFKAHAFEHSLWKVYRRAGGHGPKKRRAVQNDLSLAYTSKALGIPERTVKRLRAQATKCGLLKIIRNPLIRIGHASELAGFRKHMKGVPVFRSGYSTVSPTPSSVHFLTRT